MIPLLLFIISAVLTGFLGYFISQRLLNPATLFAFVWGGVLLLYHLRLSAWQDALSAETYYVFALTQIVFLIAYSLGCFLKLRHGVPASHKELDESYVKELFAVWLVLDVVEVFYSGGVPALWLFTDLSKNYFSFGIPSVHGFTNALGLVILLLAAYHVIENKGDRRAMLGIIACFYVYYVILITRQVLVSGTIEIICLWLLKAKKIPVAKIAVIGVCLVLAFGWIGNVRTGYESFLAVGALRDDLPPVLGGIYWVYMYLTMTVANVNNLICMSPEPMGLGVALSGLVPTAVEGALGIETSEAVSYLVTPAFTVSGYFDKYYLGAGVGGVVLITGLYGLLGGVACKAINRDPCMRNQLLYAVVIQIVALTFFVNSLGTLPIVFQLVLLLFFFRRRESDYAGLALLDFKAA